MPACPAPADQLPPVGARLQIGVMVGLFQVLPMLCVVFLERMYFRLYCLIIRFRIFIDLCDESKLGDTAMNFKDLTYSWSLPNRSAEYRQLTLRIPPDNYAKLQALKQVFPSQSINDIVNDIINESLREIIDSLQTREQWLSFYRDDMQEHDLSEWEMEEIQGLPDRERFNAAYRDALAELRNRDAQESTA